MSGEAKGSGAQKPAAGGRDAAKTLADRGGSAAVRAPNKMVSGPTKGGGYTTK